METGAGTLGVSDVETVQEQHVEMCVEIERTAEALDWCDCTDVYALLGVTGFMYQDDLSR